MHKLPRSKAFSKPKFHRLRLQKLRRRLPPKGQWYATADEEGNVRINPNLIPQEAP